MWVDFMNFEYYYYKDIMILRQCFIVLHNASAGDSANTATTRITSTFHSTTHTCTYAFIIWSRSSRSQYLPFVHKPNTLDRDRIVVLAGWDCWGKIYIMRDSLEAKMWGEVWERDFEAVPDYWQGSKINCFIFPFLQSSLHLCSLRHFLHSTIPFHNKPSLPNDENSEEIWQRSSRGFPKPYRLCRCGCQCCRSFGKQQFQSTQCRTCFDRNEKQNRTCKYTIEGTTRRIGGRAGTAGVPIGHLVSNHQCW